MYFLCSGPTDSNQRLLAFEVETALPWLGGFVLDLGGGEAERWRVALEGGETVALRGTAGFELRWRLRTPAGADAVTVRGFEATHGSAT